MGEYYNISEYGHVHERCEANTPHEAADASALHWWKEGLFDALISSLGVSVCERSKGAPEFELRVSFWWRRKDGRDIDFVLGPDEDLDDALAYDQWYPIVGSNGPPRPTVVQPGKRGKMPTIAAIAKAQQPLTARLPLEFNPTKCCWACGAKGGVERAHIVAHRNGGSMDPSNFLLLCEVCHFEQPDSAAVDAQLFWLMHHESHSARIARNAAPYIDAVRNGTMTLARAKEMMFSGLGA